MLAPTRLLVLSVVRLLQPVHGYDVRRELLSWRADEWASVAPGSVYGALKTLERDGWIEAVAQSRQGARPERTPYRVTDEGHKGFHTLLRQTWREASGHVHPLLPAVALMPAMARDGVVSELHARSAQIEADVHRYRSDIEGIESGTGDPATSVPHHIAEMLRLSLARALP
jgi:DNA-binding PadR family transcriptional regulator